MDREAKIKLIKEIDLANEYTIGKIDATYYQYLTDDEVDKIYNEYYGD